MVVTDNHQHYEFLKLSGLYIYYDDLFELIGLFGVMFAQNITQNG